MQFCTFEFVQFCVLVLIGYWVLPRLVPFIPTDTFRIVMLLGVSFCFYRNLCAELADPRLAYIVLGTALLDYFFGLGMDSLTLSRGRRFLLVCSLTVNLGVLAYLKYANFFLRSAEELLRITGRPAALPILQILLPVGISFYTFEAINYTMDVYRRRIPAERNLARFLLFILFFPHLVAGPIVRAKDFLAQIGRPKSWSWPRAQWGVSLVVMGVVKKLLVADRMAQFADPVFSDPTAFRTVAVWIAVIAYAVQIYCDFSGYTDIAIGIAHLFGYKLTRNFHMPYLSANVAEFWRRWHISLSGWLRDYLFIPLGGSRGGRWHTFRNLMITMILGGLWHGASWTFVMWGVLHGLLLVVHRLFRDFCAARPRLESRLATGSGTVLRVAMTFAAVSACWVFFRATTFGGAMEIFRRMAVPSSGRAEPGNAIGFALLLAVVAAAHAVGSSGMWPRWTRRLPAPVMGFGYAMALCLALLFAPSSGQGFIYFQF